MLKRIIIFLIRKKLGLKELEAFRFANQRSKNDFYTFTSVEILKYDAKENTLRPSTVSLNWLLNDQCNIIKLNDAREVFVDHEHII